MFDERDADVAARRRRILDAAGIPDPDAALSTAGLTVLVWLSHQSDDVVAGVVELLNAARGIDHRRCTWTRPGGGDDVVIWSLPAEACDWPGHADAMVEYGQCAVCQHEHEVTS